MTNGFTPESLAKNVLDYAGYLGGVKASERVVTKAMVAGAIKGGVSRTFAKQIAKTQLTNARRHYPRFKKAARKGFADALAKKTKRKKKKKR